MEKQKRESLPPQTRSYSLLDILSDLRVLQFIGQLAFVILLVAGLSILVINVANTMQARGLTINFGFLNSRAGFAISEAPVWYSSNSSYGQAFFVGLINTLRVVTLGLVMTTILGIFVGIFLLSTNWLIRTISKVYVEILRNTPLLVQLYFWYFIIMFSLPTEPAGVPGEGIAVMPLRLPFYLVLILIVWLYARSSGFPSRVLTGGFIALIVAEVMPGIWSGTLGLGSFSIPLLLLTSVFLLMMIFAPREWRGLAIGYIIIVVGQMIGGAAFDLFYYFGVLPQQQVAIYEVRPFLYASVKGFILPETFFTPTFAAWVGFVGLGGVLAMAVWIILGHITETTGRPYPRENYALLSIFGFALIGWLVVIAQTGPSMVDVMRDGTLERIPIEQAFAQNLLPLEDRIQYIREPLVIALPELNRFNNVIVGSSISPEYVALLLGLVVYTSGFIAEIVRAGIQAVPYGQLEAARALGLTNTQMLTQVVLPQALRIIIPPLGNQYLNLSKNSSLATAIAFADTFAIGTTAMNQSGQSLAGFALILVVYLSMSLIISAMMNVVNGRFQLVTR